MTGDAGRGQDIMITVHNEDNGQQVNLRAGPGTPLEAFINQLYGKLGVARQQDDRLRCEASGEDVFLFANLTLAEYFDAGHCPLREWVFAGGTGGA